MSWMRKRWGLRAKMAISYVLVTAAAVAVVEIILLALVVPRLLAREQANGDPMLVVQLTATDLAGRLMKTITLRGQLPNANEMRLGEPGLPLAPGRALATDDQTRVRIPYLDTPQDEIGPVSLALVFDLDRTVLLTSYPARYPVGGQYGGSGAVDLPADVLTGVLESERGGGGGASEISTGRVYWAIAPVFELTLDERRKGEEPKALGVVYVQVPADAGLLFPQGAPRLDTVIGPLFLPQLGVGLLVLLLALPVGVVFGLLSTRSLIGRVRRLAASTVAVADGDYEHRVSVSGTDEVAQLESSFNRMAERLTEAIAAERQLAGASERARIARELHDSISQDLFSLRLLAGGLRRALPEDSPLYGQVEAMERTANATMHEMQALLLELRPIGLTDAGLNPTLEELCQAYRDRLGVAVDAELEPVELAAEAEHAVLRIVQEALTNAVKHTRPSRLTLRIGVDGEHVAVSINDNGAGFDPAEAAERHGMGLNLMRERVAELGGEFELDSTIGEGTTLRIRLPRGRP
jgi:signal transduction histidine kinase